MKIMTILAAALSLALLAACDRGAPQPKASGASGSSAAPRNEVSSMPNTPANTATPSASEKHEGSNPVQGQVDPKQSEQHKDFQTNGK